MKLSDLHPGTTAIFAAFGTSALHLHLLAMGIHPGMSVQVVRRFPMKGNLYLRIGNRNLVMRNEEAMQLIVTKPE